MSHATLGDEQLQRLAELAQLSIDIEQRNQLRASLTSIIAMVDVVTRFATTNVEPMAHPLDLPTQLRADEVTESDQRTLMQAIAPATARGYYLVPRVIEG